MNQVFVFPNQGAKSHHKQVSHLKKTLRCTNPFILLSMGNIVREWEGENGLLGFNPSKVPKDGLVYHHTN